MALDKEAFKDTANKRIAYAREFWRNWKVAAKDDFDFIAGKQWLDADEQVLRNQQRPPITFNYSEKMIDAVVGAEVSNRQEVSFEPQQMDDAGQAEVYDNASKWAREYCNAEDEETDAFRDMLICGMGWTYTHMQYDEDPEGMPAVDRIDPLAMGSDPAASKPGLVDRRFHYYDEWVFEDDAKRQWPDAMFTSEEQENGATGVINRARRYNEDDDFDADAHQGQVLITRYECVEKEPYYRIGMPDPQTGQIKLQEVEVAQFNKFKKNFDELGLKYVKLYRKVYYFGFFSGETLLEANKSPCQEGFLFNCITGKRDRNANTWYGLTRVMKDPQRWANKWLSQILHIINTNAKGGLLAETGAFVDPVKAKEEWASPDSVTWLKEGGLNKVEQKQPSQYPSGLDKLMEFALGSLPMVTGINLEALGLANREQAGVLEAQRKQAAYGLLSPMFDALRRYRKVQGRVLLSLIHNFMSDGRIIRIEGKDAAQWLPLMRAPDSMKLGIRVDQSPNAPDVKQKTWESLMQLVPNMLKAGIPLPPDLLDYSPLPVGLVQKWKQFAAQQPQIPPQVQQQMQQMQQAVQQLQQENQQLKADQRTEMLKIVQRGQQMQDEVAIKANHSQVELAQRRQQMLAEIQLKREQAGLEMQLAQEKQEHDALLAERQLEIDAELARKKAAAQPASQGT